MKGHTRCNGERVENMGDHFRGKVTNFFTLEAKISDAVGSRTDIDDYA